MERIFELITAQHYVALFRCENTYLTTYLQDDALADTEDDLARTFVLVEQGSVLVQPKVIGYFTLGIDKLMYPDDNGKKVEVRVVELMYIARHIDYKHQFSGNEEEQSLGDLLMIQVLRCAAHVAEFVGVEGIHLFSTTEGQKLYERFEFHPSPYGENMYFKPIAEIREYLEAINADWIDPWKRLPTE